MEASGLRIHHPNREKPESKATKAGVVLLLVASAAVIALILIGGLSEMAGAEFVAIAWILIYAVMAYFVARWNRGVLPLAAGMGIVLTSFAAIAAPSWFARDRPGLDDPLLPSGLVGLLVLVLIALQVLLILFSARAFRQEWNIEIEYREGDEGYDELEQHYQQAEAERSDGGGNDRPDDYQASGDEVRSSRQEG